MKINFLILLLLTFSTVALSQSYMDKIAKESCECLDNISDSLEPKLYQMELGMCMINAAMPYKKKLKKDYKIDFNKIDEQGEELGQIIGAKMGMVCPEALVKIANKFEDVEDEPNGDAIDNNSFNGKIVDIEQNQFVTFSIKDERGKVTKFYWFNFIESYMDLPQNYKTLKDKSVQIYFSTQEFFDPKIGEYRNFNIIESLEQVEE